MTVDPITAAREAAVAVFAYRDGRGRPLAVPVTPYVLNDRVVVTSTLAYARKALLIRNDSRVALLANGVHMIGDAAVFADPDGDVFVARYLEQELEKYPPSRMLVQVPNYRQALSWYFGRSIISFTPREAQERPGDDGLTLVTIAAEGHPSISPLPATDVAAESFAVDASDGPALVVLHRESSDMSDLRKAAIRGHVRGGVFHVRERRGTLDEPGFSEFNNAERELAAREMMKDWEPAE